MSFLSGDVNNFVVGSEDGMVYTACRHGRYKYLLEGRNISLTVNMVHFLSHVVLIKVFFVGNFGNEFPYRPLQNQIAKMTAIITLSISNQQYTMAMHLLPTNIKVSSSFYPIVFNLLSAAEAANVLRMQ